MQISVKKLWNGRTIFMRQNGFIFSFVSFFVCVPMSAKLIVNISISRAFCQIMWLSHLFTAIEGFFCMCCQWLIDSSNIIRVARKFNNFLRLSCPSIFNVCHEKKRIKIKWESFQYCLWLLYGVLWASHCQFWLRKARIVGKFQTNIPVFNVNSVLIQSNGLHLSIL